VAGDVLALNTSLTPTWTPPTIPYTGVTGLVPKQVLYGSATGTIEQNPGFTFDKAGSEGDTFGVGNGVDWVTRIAQFQGITVNAGPNVNGSPPDTSAQPVLLFDLDPIATTDNGYYVFWFMPAGTTNQTMIMQLVGNAPAPFMDMNFNQIKWVADPTTAMDAANKEYVDAHLQGRPLALTAPTLNQVMGWNGTTWTPQTVAAGGGGTKTIPGPYNVLTMQLAGLGQGGYWASAATVEPSAGYPLDEQVSFSIKLAATGVAATGEIVVYAYASLDGGVTYTENLTGASANVGSLIQNPTNLKVVGKITANVNGLQATGGPFSIAAAFSGVVPDHWGVVIFNNTNAAFDPTETNHKKQYQGFFTG
jgi:hypothetical protein